MDDDYRTRVIEAARAAEAEIERLASSMHGNPLAYVDGGQLERWGLALRDTLAVLAIPRPHPPEPRDEIHGAIWRSLSPWASAATPEQEDAADAWRDEVADAATDAVLTAIADRRVALSEQEQGTPTPSLPDPSGVTVTPEAFVVSRLPDGPDRSVWSVRIESAGRGRWAVRSMSRCLNKSGEWEYEPLPSSREDDWLDTVRWSSLTEATDAAVAAEPFLEWNGLTPADVLARAASRPDVAPQPEDGPR